MTFWLLLPASTPTDLQLWPGLSEGMGHCLLRKAIRTLTMSQFAYLKLPSTITYLISVSDYWYENIDKNDVNFALFLNLKKAFDTVDHEIIIRKLKVYGIDGIELGCFRSYVSCRLQYCTATSRVPNKPHVGYRRDPV